MNESEKTSEEEGSLSSQDEDAILFERLVPLDDGSGVYERLLGMIVYAHCVIDKNQFIDQYIRERGRAPSEETVRDIIFSFSDENSEKIKALRHKAGRLLDDYAEQNYRNKSIAEFVQPIDDLIRKRSRFWVAVSASLMATFLYSLLIAIVIFIATVTNPDSTFAQIFRLLLEDLPAQ